MKRIMWFDLYGNKVAVYQQEDVNGEDYFTIYQLVGKKKYYIDDSDSITEAAQIAMNFCYENA